MTPEEALAQAKNVADLYAQAAADLLAIIARNLAKGIASPAWATSRLAMIVPLRAQAQARVAQLQAQGPAAAVAMVRSVYDRTRTDGITSVDTRAVEALAADTQRVLSSAAPQLLRWVEDAYRQAVADAVGPTVIGVANRRQATARVMDRLAAQGVGAFRDSAGRTWRLDTYAEMAVRTAVGRAHLAGTIDQYQAEGITCVVVSDSPEECPRCRPFEGNVLSLTGVPPVGLPAGMRYMGTLASAVARGLHHPNCTHREHAYIPGGTRPIRAEMANPDGYEDRQRQRDLERRVRESSRRVAALEPIGQTPELARQRQLLAARRRELRAFNAAHHRKQGVSNQRTQPAR